MPLLVAGRHADGKLLMSRFRSLSPPVSAIALIQRPVTVTGPQRPLASTPAWLESPFSCAMLPLRSLSPPLPLHKLALPCRLRVPDLQTALAQRIVAGKHTMSTARATIPPTALRSQPIALTPVSNSAIRHRAVMVAYGPLAVNIATSSQPAVPSNRRLTEVCTLVYEPMVPFHSARPARHPLRAQLPQAAQPVQPRVQELQIVVS